MRALPQPPGGLVRMLFRVSPLLASSFVALGCGSDPAPMEEGQKDPGPATGSTCPSSSTLTYANFGQDFFTSYCVRCHSSSPADGSRHGAPPGLNWDDLEIVRENANRIDKMAAAGPSATNTIMPPNMPRPTDEERTQLGEWLACGAPD